MAGGQGVLVQFCQEHNPDPDDEDPYEWVISYEELIALGRQAVEEAKADSSEFGFCCGSNMTMMDALQENSQEFWKNWSIVTGIPLPPDAEEKSYFSCAC